MPLPFSEICVLLSRLEDVELRDPPYLLTTEKSAHVKEVTESWFKSHRRHINELDIENSVALLSTLLPERRTDRVYGIQSPSLCRILSRCLNLGIVRTKDLQAYKQPGHGDLATCLERILVQSGPPALPNVMLREGDDMLQTLAGKCRFSNIQQLPHGSSESRDQLLGNVLKRLSPNEGKWLVRLILKDFSPVRVNEHIVLKSFHFLLPDLLRFQNQFEAAIGLLKGMLQEYPGSPDPRSQRLLRQGAAKLLKPTTGVKVGRPMFLKARSIDHCMKMLGGKKWVLERKYDGEYCEIHIDLAKSVNVSECITMFSKSGKNSTTDRKQLHQTLVECLSLGKLECKIKQQAILLGEMVVYCDKKHQIRPFEKIRKHVSRSGSFLGADEDSQPYPYEHLAIVFFDLLLLDGEVVMRRPVEERRTWLREVYRKIRGRAMGAEWKIVDFEDQTRAKKALVQQFAASIAQRCEGLVLKPCGVPYFCLDSASIDYARGWIKLKKDYIADLGDEADFAVIGASYNAHRALKAGISNIKWTDFHLACLLNKADVLRFDARPCFKVIGSIREEAFIPKSILQAANTLGTFSAKPHDGDHPPANFDLGLSYGIKCDATFDVPLLFEVLGSGFEKPPNSNFFTLRHARVKKLHQDRTWKDCVSMQELQERAAASRAAPPDSESQETRRWIEKLEKKCKKKAEREQTATPRTRTTATPTTVGTARTSILNRTRSAARSVSLALKPAPTSMQVLDQARSPLDGTTLISNLTSGSKRMREHDETPSTAMKRRCPADVKPNADKETSKVAPRKTAPLSDITNTAAHSSPSNNEEADTNRRANPRGVLQILSTLFRPLLADATCRTLDTHEELDLHHQQSGRCAGSACLFANAVVYLAPCISNTPYVVQDLLPAHNIISVLTLDHWGRDSFAHEQLKETVSESQSFEGMRKLVLVEANRRRAVKDVIQQMLMLNKSRMRERVDVYDWRVLEGCTDHDLAAGGAKRYFLGATMFDERRERAMFVANVPWLVE